MKKVKRKHDPYNPYEIYTSGSEHHVIFIDSNGVNQDVLVSEELYSEFDRFEREDAALIERNRRRQSFSSIGEIEEGRVGSAWNSSDIEYALLICRVKEWLQILTSTQRRRMMLYCIYGYTLKEIAEKENCSIKSVSVSIKSARKKLEKVKERG